LYDYTLPGGLPAGSRAAWSSLPFRPLSVGVLTPLSYSVLAEIAGRAWFHYFDRLAFEPIPRARLVRQVNGVPYINLTLSAQRDAEQAAIEPLTLRINQQPFPICKWEKPGFMAGMKAGFKERRITHTLNSLAQEMSAVTQRAQEWFQKVRDFRWTQAEILFVMEEIEPSGAESMMPFFAARHNLDWHLNRILRLTQAKAPFPQSWRLLQQALGTVETPLEKERDAQLLALAQAFSRNDQVQRWLQETPPPSSGKGAPDSGFGAALDSFVERYGHWGSNGAELRQARWGDDPASLLNGVAARGTKTPLPVANPQPLLAAISSGEQKPMQESLEQVHKLLVLQSQALHALAYVLAGTRRWALAAGREALGDQRIAALDDIFFFELEEIKEMMTGEWNVSDASEIRATAEKRKAEYQSWRSASSVPELLIGESPAQPTAAWQQDSDLV
jgi:pyruvate,water dikinase